MYYVRLTGQGFNPQARELIHAVQGYNIYSVIISYQGSTTDLMKLRGPKYGWEYVSDLPNPPRPPYFS
jgi:hypothetical protein